MELETPETFEPNAFYERLLEMRRTNRKAFENLSPPSKLALLQYEKMKREHVKEAWNEPLRIEARTDEQSVKNS